MGNGLAGILLDLGLGVEGDTQSGNGEHGQVVCSVTNGNGLLQADLFLFCDLAQQFSFFGSVYDVADNLLISLPSLISRRLA